MHVGLCVLFTGSLERSDHEVYRDEVALARLGEPLGFESIWGVEHHFTSYAMCPDVLQFLTYMAGQTEHVQLGSMVVVLPWHDPVRVAEQVSMLDHLSGGRVILGLGRGLGRVEFEGFGVDMNESRERFVEASRMILDALETGSIEYEGTFYKQVRRDLRPRPFKTFHGRTYAVAVSPESSRIMAALGVGLLIVPQKQWETVVAELDAYRGLYREVNRCEAPAPRCAVWVFVDHDAARARDLGRRYLSAYYGSVLDHYELTSGHLATAKGYEYYAQRARQISEHGTESARNYYADLHVYGTPAQCVAQLREIHCMIGNDSFIAVCSFADMPFDEAERNQRLFASAVMPEVKTIAC